MKKYGIVRTGIMVCLILFMTVLPPGRIQVQAKEVVATVEGTVLSGTTSELLRLSTKEGTMEIKLDSDTDTSACKILLAGRKVSVSVSHESDGYLHAVKISSDAQISGYTIDTSTTATVTGTINQKTRDDIIFLDTPQGEMQIKFDTTTNMNGCSLLVEDKKYTISCARGSDAYMHAITISDASSSSAVGLSSTPSHVATMSVTGTVSSRTKEDILYLSTKEGTMQFKIDSDADTGRGLVHVAGNELTVSFYHGTDAYLHAVTIVGEKEDSSSAEIDTSKLSTVTGTVDDRSTEDILYLNTEHGRMELKLDALNSMSGVKVLIEDMKIKVTCARGSDAYMHAISIEDN